MSFPPPPPQPNEPPAPGPWQSTPQQPGPYGQPPYPQQPYAAPNPQFAPYGQAPPPGQDAPPAGYGQPVRPGWQPPQPVEPTPAPGRAWVVPTVVIASLVTIGGVFAASAARSDEDAPDAADGARDAVVRLTESMHQGDCAGVEAASTGGYFRSMNLTCDDIADNGAWMDEVGMSFVIGEADLDGDTAEVPVEIVVTSDPSQNTNGHFTVVRTGESWRVSNDQTD